LAEELGAGVILIVLISLSVLLALVGCLAAWSAGYHWGKAEAYQEIATELSGLINDAGQPLSHADMQRAVARKGWQ
jgi:hypothetical protein